MSNGRTNEREKEARGLWQSGRFFHGLGDSPFLPSNRRSSPPCPVGIIRPVRSYRESASHGNRGSLRAHTPLLVPSRYLMVRVKSPITQLPRRVYARARIHANGRVCIVDIKAPDLTALDPAYDSVLCTSTYVRAYVCRHCVFVCIETVVQVCVNVRLDRAPVAFALPPLMPLVANDLPHVSRPERASC